jgi:hypothetical protein
MQHGYGLRKERREKMAVNVSRELSMERHDEYLKYLEIIISVLFLHTSLFD